MAGVGTIIGYVAVGTLVAALLWNWLASRASAPAEPLREYVPEDGEAIAHAVRVYPSWVAGLSYADERSGRSREEYASQSVSIGDALVPRREPNNPYDSGAVRLEHGRFHLGYVPKDHGWVGEAIDEGRAVSIVVAAIGYTNAGNLRIGVDIVVSDEIM